MMIVMIMMIMMKYFSKMIDWLILRILELFANEVCEFLKK